MAKALPVAESERLPWLSDTAPAKAKPRRRRSLAPPLLFLGLMAAIGFGSWTVLQQPPEPAPAPVRSSEEIALPPPKAAPPPAIEPQAPSPSERQALRPEIAREPDPAPAPSAERSRPAVKRATARPRPARPSKAPREHSQAAAAPSAAYDARAWRSGVPGRIIQLGAYRSSASAQSEWRRVYYRYPLLRPLSPRVIKSKIRGRTYYRLQLGTFSQAHSELLCQRLRATGQGCMVVGLRKRGRR